MCGLLGDAVNQPVGTSRQVRTGDIENKKRPS